MTNQSVDIYQYTINTSVIAGGTQNYDVHANDTSNNMASIGTNSFTVRTLDLFIQSVIFEDIIVEGTDSIVQINISNSENVACIF